MRSSDTHLMQSVTTTPRPFTFVSSSDPVLRAQPHRLATSLTVHADQKPRERVLLYALVFALAPKRVLEIGVRWGGGTRIIHAAMKDLGHAGCIVSIDPQPEFEGNWDDVSDCTQLVIGASPGALYAASERAGGDFDFVFIDGDHSYQGALADLLGVVNVTQPGAIVLLHDAYHPPVARAIQEALATHAFTDCGLLATTRNDGIRAETGADVIYGGVHMLRRTEVT
jgi:predicted O-methyltransferase YrrM